MIRTPGARSSGRGWGRGGGMMGAALLLALLPLAGGAQQVMGRGASPDTVQTDSTRIRVMEALERISRPPVARQLIVDGDSAFLAGVAAAVEARRRSPAARGPASMTAGADSVMAALLELPGYDPARYEGEYAEFEAGEGRLTLLSSAGLALRRPGGVPDSVFPGDSLSGAAPGAAPDTAAGVPDPGALPPDSIALPPDTIVGLPDTAVAATPPDTVLVGETVVIVPDSVALPDSGAVTVPVPEALQEGDTVSVEDAIVPTRLFFEGREI